MIPLEVLSRLREEPVHLLVEEIRNGYLEGRIIEGVWYVKKDTFNKEMVDKCMSTVFKRCLELQKGPNRKFLTIEEGMRRLTSPSNDYLSDLVNDLYGKAMGNKDVEPYFHDVRLIERKVIEQCLMEEKPDSKEKTEPFFKDSHPIFEYIFGGSSTKSIGFHLGLVVLSLIGLCTGYASWDRVPTRLNLPGYEFLLPIFIFCASFAFMLYYHLKMYIEIIGDPPFVAGSRLFAFYVGFYTHVFFYFCFASELSHPKLLSFTWFLLIYILLKHIGISLYIAAMKLIPASESNQPVESAMTVPQIYALVCVLAFSTILLICFLMVVVLGEFQFSN